MTRKMWKDSLNTCIRANNKNCISTSDKNRRILCPAIFILCFLSSYPNMEQLSATLEKRNTDGAQWTDVEQDQHENFSRAVRILTAAWGGLYLITPIWTYILMGREDKNGKLPCWFFRPVRQLSYFLILCLFRFSSLSFTISRRMAYTTEQRGINISIPTIPMALPPMVTATRTQIEGSPTEFPTTWG
ncbi:hypothetical protein BN3590_00929 [Clostridium sp. C105KSO15]|nr:hypothetical protein BN3590_00929 [Clostridium sp. C105KSO15]